ncbi:MAG: DUF6493 family protein [Planctomycetaceae bacterium]|jgi:hypothetical protein|nr:DUF6493 family protein [Planctomycetaceae bacterium]
MPKKVSTTMKAVELPKTLSATENEELRNILLSANAEKITTFFNGMPEKKRRELAPICIEWIKKLWDTNFFYKTAPRCFGFPDGTTCDDAYGYTEIALFATADFTEIQRLFRISHQRFHCKHELVENVLRARNPVWIGDFILLALTIDQDYWFLYRRFVTEKIIKPIINDEMARTMFMVMDLRGHDIYRWKALPISQQIKNDTDLLKNEIPQLFKVNEFPSGFSYTNIDREHRWKEALIALVADGTLLKNELIELCLSALERPHTEYQGKWFVQILERLPFDGNDLKTFAKQFLLLISHRNPSPSVFGFSILERLFKENKISDTEVLEILPPVVRDPSQKRVKKAIAILDKIAGRNKTLHPEIMKLVLECLPHENSEIQLAALKLLKKYDTLNNPNIAESVRQIAESLAPSIKKLLPDIIIQAQTSITVQNLKEPEPTTESIKPPKTVLEKIVPIKSFDELLDLATRLLEKPEDADEIERLLGGLARLGANHPSSFEAKTSALLLRSFKLLGTRSEKIDGKTIYDLHVPDPFQGCDIQTDFRYLFAAWITGKVPIVEANHLEIADHVWKKVYTETAGIPATKLFSARMKAVAEIIVAGKSVQLLSTPTHYDGWIDPNVFAERLIESETQNIETDNYDRVLALLRLYTEGRENALKLIDGKTKKRNDYINAVRYALGADGIKIGKTDYYWIAAARCRNPFADDPAVESVFTGYGPDSGAAAAQYKIKKEADRIYRRNKIAVECLPPTKNQLDLTLFPTIGLHTAETFVHGEEPGQYPWTLTIWLQNPAPAVAVALDTHSTNLDNANTEAGFRHALAAIARPYVSFHPIYVSAIFTALAMKCPQVYTTATDTAIITIQDGRLTSAMAVQPVQDLLRLEILTINRWLKPLKTITEQSQLHTLFVHELLENIVENLPPKNVTGFLGLLYEIGISLEKPITSKTCRKYLETLSGSGNAGKLAKKLLET